MPNPNQEEYRNWIIKELTVWRDTLIYKGDKEGHENLDILIKRFKFETCNQDDYEMILFHLWHKHYEDKI